MITTKFTSFCLLLTLGNLALSMPCPACIVGPAPSSVTLADPGAPVGVSMAFINPKRTNGQCMPPSDCAAKPCRFYGTLQIYNGSVTILSNAQILVGGIAVTPPGALPIGGYVNKTYTAPDAIEAACGRDGSEVVATMSVTSNDTQFTATMKFGCAACQ